MTLYDTFKDIKIEKNFGAKIVLKTAISHYLGEVVLVIDID